MTWCTFLQAHWPALAAADFLTTEVWTARGLVTYHVAFLLEVQSRRIQVIGCTPFPNEVFVIQCLRQVTGDAGRRRPAADSRLRSPVAQWGRGVAGHSWCACRSDAACAPNRNAHAERFVRSVQEECLNRLVPLGEQHLRRTLHEFAAHYHRERNHQGLANELIDHPPEQTASGAVRRRQRLGGFSQLLLPVSRVTTCDLIVDRTRFSPRFRAGGLVRKLTWQGDLDYITDATGAVVEERAVSALFGVVFNSGDGVTVSATKQYELLPLDFAIAPGVVVPAGGYRYETVNASYNVAAKRMVSGSASASYGSFYDGTRTTARYTGRAGLSPHFAIEPSLTFNWVRIPYGDFDANLIGMRFLVSPTARLGFSSLTQFNASADTLTFRVRTRWEYSPGSDLYVVYSDGRNTASAPRLEPADPIVRDQGERACSASERWRECRRAEATEV